MKRFTLLNTLTNTVEELAPPSNTITWYMCGPTVYDHSHIGHARNYIVNDVLRRILTAYGYDVRLAMNITDVDDKIIKRSVEEFKDPNNFRQIAKKFEKSFFEDMNSLNVQMPDLITRASQYIPETIGFISILIDNGYAYQAEDTANVYFDSQQYYQDYTDSFSIKSNDVMDDTHLQEKKDSRDFALWKQAKPGEPFWESPWGQGRPGWHIECSAMSADIFGPSFTIHSGGIDLRFPHHENEMKQAKARYGTNSNCASYFIHVGHLHIDGAKMSKSLKNFITIKEILKQASASELRMLFLLHKYNHPMDYSEARLEQAKEIVQLFTSFFQNVETLEIEQQGRHNQTDLAVFDQINQIKHTIEEGISVDFNTPVVVANLQKLVKVINKYILEPYQITVVQNTTQYVRRILNIFGLELDKKPVKSNMSALLDELCNFRDKVRGFAFERKQYDLLAVTDEVRDKSMPGIGIAIEDKGRTASCWKIK